MNTVAPHFAACHRACTCAGRPQLRPVDGQALPPVAERPRLALRLVPQHPLSPRLPRAAARNALDGQPDAGDAAPDAAWTDAAARAGR
eukprot:4177938-Pleurochrysis_carterae.AAC.1